MEQLPAARDGVDERDRLDADLLAVRDRSVGVESDLEGPVEGIEIGFVDSRVVGRRSVVELLLDVLDEVAARLDSRQEFLGGAEGDAVQHVRDQRQIVRARNVGGARELRLDRVDPTLEGAGRGERGTSDEQPVQEVRAVAEVDLAVSVGIRRVEARGARAAEEEVVEQSGCVGDVDHGVRVEVAAHEVLHAEEV